MIRLGDAGHMGRGVFSTKYISAGTKIMTGHTVHLTENDLTALENTTISGHFFNHPKDEKRGLFVLGLITMINHSPEPNVEVILRKKKDSYIAECIALKDIDYRDQLFLDYGDDITF